MSKNFFKRILGLTGIRGVNSPVNGTLPQGERMEANDLEQWQGYKPRRKKIRLDQLPPLDIRFF